MVFAEVFDRLAENVLLPPDKQFEARAGGKAYRRLDEFLEALSELGYRVEVSIEGQAAHATGLAYRDETEAVTEIPTPILVRTGIKDTFGQEAIVPALHSSLAIRVRSTPQSKGPRVDADLSWYTGLRGTHFYPANLYADPKWAGHVDIDTLSTAEAQRAVHLAGVFGAATNEYASAEGLWLNGYGVLGVCNDAVAAIQAALRGKTSLFPLLMDRGEDEAALGRVAALGDARDRSAVEELLKQVRTLPTDHGSEPSLRERALKSLPSLADGSMLPIARGARRILTGEKPAATATGASPNRLRAMFDRMDSRKASRVARADVQGYLEDLGLGTGFLGPQIVQNGSRVFLERLDEDGDQTVTYEELVRRIPQLLPKGLRGASGSLEASQIDPAMDAIAGPGADRASLGQLVAYLRDEYTREARDQFARAMASKVAEVAGRVALDILDGDGDGYFTKEDLKALLAETQRKSERGKA